jgi:uncharacterized protein (DUF2141 family)
LEKFKKIKTLIMKNQIFLALVLLCVPFVNNAQIDIVVEISSLKNNDGHLLLELNDENKETIGAFSEKIADNKSIVVLKNLKPGKYAFKYFHDENDDEKLNTNVIGMPKEGYGFSNNAKGTFGIPSFDKMVFEVTKADTLKCVPIYLGN